MKKINNSLLSLLNAAGVFIYVTLVALFMFNVKNIFGNKPDNFLAPLFMLLLFIVSAAITGLLVLGKPIQLYLDGSKKEAIKMLFSTLGYLVILLFIVVLFLVFR